MSVLANRLVRERLIEIGATLPFYRHGGGDPTTSLNGAAPKQRLLAMHAW
jgi:hypothetical protein